MFCASRSNVPGRVTDWNGAGLASSGWANWSVANALWRPVSASLQSWWRYSTFLEYILTTPRRRCPDIRSAMGTPGSMIRTVVKRHKEARFCNWEQTKTVFETTKTNKLTTSIGLFGKWRKTVFETAWSFTYGRWRGCRWRCSAISWGGVGGERRSTRWRVGPFAPKRFENKTCSSSSSSSLRFFYGTRTRMRIRISEGTRFVWLGLMRLEGYIGFGCVKKHLARETMNCESEEARCRKALCWIFRFRVLFKGPHFILIFTVTAIGFFKIETCKWSAINCDFQASSQVFQRFDFFFICDKINILLNIAFSCLKCIFGY